MLDTAERSHSLFFSPEDDGCDFASVLRQVQGHIASNYASLIANGGSDSREQINRYSAKYIQDKGLVVKGMSTDELVDAIYSEMAEFGFLTKYVFGVGVEEIDINSWRDIEVQYSDGRNEKLKEHFESPEHAVNVIRRMLHVSGVILDNASPVVVGTLSQNIRIAALKTPVVDKDVGIAASIRIVNPQRLMKEDFVKGGSATVEMLDFLASCLRYGISICVAGATSSGKTTVAGWLLTTIPDNKRIFTIENGSRELALVREKGGKVTNSVIHTVTRDSENERQCISQITLLDVALRFNPDILVVGEMRGAEANAAQEAARTGVAVLTTIHSNSCEATYRRMVSLCKRAVDMSDETLMGYVESLELIFSASRSRRLMMVPIIQSFGQLQKNYGKEGSEIIIDNCQDTIFGGFAPNSQTAEVLSKALGSRTVMSGSISRGKNDPSQSLQMMERPLVTPDELKSMPKGSFVVMKTGSHPMRTRLLLFLDWGITFKRSYTVPEKAQRKVAYADKSELERRIISRHLTCVDEDDDSDVFAAKNGLLHSPSTEPVSINGSNQRQIRT